MTVLFECRIDERDQDVHANESYVESVESLARAVIDARENIPLGFIEFATKQEWMHRLSYLAFACEHPSRRRRTPVDVEKMVETWMPLIVRLAIAHDIDERDAASAKLDEFLTPIIAAPVAQIREFYRELMRRMKADPSVPWAVWKMFEFWGTNVLDKIEKEEVIGLKTELAKRIAERSFGQIPATDWITSMADALQWRDPETLKKVEAVLDKGEEKPRVKGRQSCLFLVLGEAEVML